MKIEYRNTPKICSLSAGDVVRLLNESFEPCGDPHLVIRIAEGVKGSRKGFDSYGMYNDPNNYTLVNMKTGVAITMPHLSTRVQVYRDAVLSLLAGSDDGHITQS